ncbi:hypothetical protein P3S68_004508 [Capsicum galapagoense]
MRRMDKNPLVLEKEKCKPIFHYLHLLIKSCNTQNVEKEMVEKNGILFSRHLEKIICDRNICSLGVSSWSDISQEKLNHMWLAVENKLLQQALKNKPNGIDKKEWEWLVKEYFSFEAFQDKSKRNAANRAKLTMLHHMGIDMFVFDVKGGGGGSNPPDLETIFYESRRKNNKLVEPEAIQKHAQIEEIVNAEPSLSSIEIVEKCFGPQNRSHVVAFGVE